MIHEYEYDEHTILLVEFTYNDNSYDDEFGRVREPLEPEIKSLSIVTYIGGLDFDITEYFEPKPDLYRIFTEHAIEKRKEELANE
jgi:hypothetical protein